jgi:UDP-glucose 4-epimerase
MTTFNPDILLHMAAQPLVRYSYDNPIETYEVNVIGTAKVAAICSKISGLKVVILLCNLSWSLISPISEAIIDSIFASLNNAGNVGGWGN